MKYIKTYENIFKNNLKELSNYLLLFINKIVPELEVFFTNNNDLTDFTFWYNVNNNKRFRRSIFNMYSFDYYTGDDFITFKIKLDIGVLKNKDYLPKELFDAVNFIFYKMKNYNKEDNIKITDINNIINDINLSNYQIYTKTKNYNL